MHGYVLSFLPHFFFFFLLLSLLFLFCLYVHFSFVEPLEGLGLAADVGVSAAATPTAPTAPIPTISFAPAFAVFTASVSAVPFVPIYVLPTAPIITGPGELSFPLFPSSFLPRGFVSPFLFLFLRFLVPCLMLF